MTFGLRAAGLLLGLIFVVAVPSLLRVYTDWLWFGEVGYTQVYTGTLAAQSVLFLAGFVVVAAWAALNLTVALRSVGEARPVFTTRDGLEVALPGRRQLQALVTPVSLVLGLVGGLMLSTQWETWLLWQHGAPFGQADPLLGHDVGYYVFSLPFFHLARGVAQALVVLAAVVAGALYFVTGSLTGAFPARLFVGTGPRRHLALLAALFLLLLGVGAWLDRAEQLLSASGTLYGASYADVHGRMPGLVLLAVVSVAGAALAAWQAVTPRSWPILVAGGMYLAVSVGGETYGTLLQRFVVGPNEQVREEPFIRFNIDATRRAFALDRVEERELSGDATLTSADIARSGATLENVRLWDHQPLLDTFGQIQEIRTYYDFVSVDNDRYSIDGRMRQVMLSARELNSNSLPNRTWINERLTFTHGYGLTLGPVNQVTAEGLPTLFVRNLPPETIPDLPIREPSLYFGELSSDYAIVRTRTKEFHYPRGDENVFNQYDGRGGLALDSLWRKLLFAVRFGAYQIALTDDIGPESRILFHRNIRERVQEIAPFLTFDQDPYLVIADGRLFWMYDAYTTSGRYPYATRAGGGLNYIRNSVKVVIDAYHGTTTFYLADTTDPIAATYARMFPGLFTPLSSMPAALRSHIRYPEDIFRVQASMYATFHMTQPAAFYNREDQWEVPSTEDDREAAPMQPYYTIMRLPGETDAEFIQMLPFTPRRKDNLSAWLVARSDSEHYGTLRVFQFPKQKVVFGPRQVVARINQDQTISPQITLWNQQGSQVTWGTLMVIPIEESLLYVRPLYLRGAGGRIPELRRVVVVHQNQIVMESTLDAALARLFGDGRGPASPTPSSPPSAGPSAETSGTAGATPVGGSPATGALAAEAQRHYDNAIAAQRAGDWARYGEELRQLGDVLARMTR